jgi:hypothetical protein
VLGMRGESAHPGVLSACCLRERSMLSTCFVQRSMLARPKESTIETIDATKNKNHVIIIIIIYYYHYTIIINYYLFVIIIRVLERAVGSTRSARSGSDRMDRIEGFYQYVDRNGSYAVPVRSSKCHARGLCIVFSLYSEACTYVLSTFLNDVKTGTAEHIPCCTSAVTVASLIEGPVAWCGQIYRHTGRNHTCVGQPVLCPAMSMSIYYYLLFTNCLLVSLSKSAIVW